MEKKLNYSTTHPTMRSTSEKPIAIEYFAINRKNMLLYLMKLATVLRSHTYLLLLGTTSELIYLFYLLRDFPLASYSQKLTDMGGITGFSHQGFLTFIIAFSFLFVVFGLAWWEARSYQDHTTLWIILGFGAIFAFTTIFVYPINAQDLFYYFTRSLVMVQHGANPMVTPPSQFPKDPLMQLAGWVINWPSPYGPLAQLIHALPVLIAGRHVLASLLLFKLIFSAMLIVEAFFIYKILLHIAPKLALSGALALAWNPFALLEYSANSHNDIAMTLLITLAVFALVKECHVWAMTLITASVLIKFASLAIIPLFFIYSFRQQPTKKARITYTTKAVIVFLSVVIDSYALFWAGLQTFQRPFTQVQNYLDSFSIFLFDFSSASISYDHAKMIGWALFGACFLYALWLSSRDFLSMLKACSITMFTLLAFGTTFVQPWYFIWPFAVAILIPRISVSLVSFLLLYTAGLTELVHAYIVPWVGYQNVNIYVIESIAYLTTFLPSALFLLAARFKPTLPQSPSSIS